MTNTALLEAKIAERGLKKVVIADALKITPMTLSRKISNENEFIASEMQILTKMLGLNYKQFQAIFFA